MQEMSYLTSTSTTYGMVVCRQVNCKMVARQTAGIQNCKMYTVAKLRRLAVVQSREEKETTTQASHAQVTWSATNQHNVLMKHSNKTPMRKPHPL